MTAPFTESVVEQAALAWLESIGWQVAHGPDIAPDLSACAVPVPRRGRRLCERMAGLQTCNQPTPALAFSRHRFWRSADMNSCVLPMLGLP